MKRLKGHSERAFSPTAHAGFWAENMAKSLIQHGVSHLCAMSSEVGHRRTNAWEVTQACVGLVEGAEGHSHVRGLPGLTVTTVKEKSGPGW